MSAHTPGPWRIRIDGTLTDAETKIANARLIAAAPDLLAALELALPLLRETRDGILDFSTLDGPDGSRIDPLRAKRCREWIAPYDAAVDAAERAIARAAGKEVS